MGKQLKFNGYEDVQLSVTLLKDVADIEPYSITLPQPQSIELISNYGLPKDEQVFRREVIPRKIWDITKDLNTGKISREECTLIVKKDKELQSFIADQWRKRENGVWVYINGRPLFITGTYWWYLNYYLLDTGRHPEFRSNDMEEFQWWKFCVEDDPNVYGGINFTRRRVGKTFKAGAIQLEFGTKTANAKCGLQSKSEKDAEEFFRKAIVYQFRRLPFFWRPEFESTGKMKKSIEMVDSSDPDKSFESFLDYQSSTATAYDGQKLHRYVLDECGKMENPINPIAIWDKVKWCLFEDGKIVGKALLTTTVETMEKGGGDKFKYLFNNSSRIAKDEKLNKLGQTETGLVAYYTSGYDNMFHDRYGMSIRDEPTLEQKKWRKEVKKDLNWQYGGKEYVDMQIAGAKNSREMQSVIRKFAPTIKDSFRYSNDVCLFDISVINKRLGDFFGSANSIYPRNFPMTFGYFQWVKGKEFKEAEFIATDEKSARCHIRYMPPPDQRNRWGMKNGKQTPANTARFNMGADPFKLKTEQVIHRDRMSEGAGHVYALLDPAVDNLGKPRDQWVTDNFVLEYLFRPETPDLFAEDMAMIAVFYGCKIFPENNINIIDKCFREWELSEYLQFQQRVSVRNNIATYKEDKTIAGAYNIDSLKPTLIRHGINYIREKGMYCPFPRTLEQFRDVSYDTFSHYDAAVSGLFTLTGVFDVPVKKESKNKVNFGNDLPIPELRTYN